MLDLAIVCTAHNRPDYFQESLSCWSKTDPLLRGVPFSHRKLQQIVPFKVFLEPSNNLAEMHRVYGEFGEESCDLFDITIHENETKQGVLVNPFNALSWGFDSGKEFVILAEDDIEVSQDVLSYFAWASEEFKYDQSILTVNAWADTAVPTHDDQYSEVVPDSHFSPLIWGTWKDRWDEVLQPTWDKDYSFRGWDWHINDIIKERSLYTVRPSVSRSNHIGKFNGTHMMPDNFNDSQSASFTRTPPSANFFFRDSR